MSWLGNTILGTASGPHAINRHQSMWSFKLSQRKVLFVLISKVTEMISLSSKKFIELARKHSDCETAQKADEVG